MYVCMYVSPTKGVKGDPRGLQCMSIFPSPPSLVITQIKKKALKLPFHRYLPTPNISFSPSSLLFQAIFPSSLLCTSPLLKEKVWAGKSKIEDYFLDFAWYRTPPDGKIDKNFLCLFPKAKTVILLNCKHFPLFILVT